MLLTFFCSCGNIIKSVQYKLCCKSFQRSDTMVNTNITEIIAALVPAVLAMALIYAVTANLQKIASFIDKMLRPDKQPEDDGLFDIYAVRKTEDPSANTAENMNDNNEENEHNGGNSNG